MADGRKGEKLTGLARFWIYHVDDNDQVQVDINRRSIDPAKIKRVDPSARRGGLPGVQYEISLVDFPSLQGDNELGLRLMNPSDRKATPYMEELEVTVDVPDHK